MAKLKDDELKLLKETFKGNMPLLVALRKIILPEFDMDGEVGQQTDLWQPIVSKIADMQPQEAIIKLTARGLMVSQLEAGLDKIRMIAEGQEPTKEELAKRALKDSAK